MSKTISGYPVPFTFEGHWSEEEVNELKKIAIEFWPRAIINLAKDEFSIPHVRIYKDDESERQWETFGATDQNSNLFLHIILEEEMILFDVYNTSGEAMRLADSIMSRLRVMREKKEAS